VARRKTPSCVKKGAKRSRYSEATLQKVYNRGVGAHKTNRASVRNMQGKKYAGGKKMSAPQWACARVNSFLRGSKKHDTDLRRRRR